MNWKQRLEKLADNSIIKERRKYYFECAKTYHMIVHEQGWIALDKKPTPKYVKRGKNKTPTLNIPMEISRAMLTWTTENEANDLLID